MIARFHYDRNQLQAFLDDKPSVDSQEIQSHVESGPDCQAKLETMAQSDFDFMVLAVRGLMFAHALALLAYSFGDEIMSAFDKNKNGVPDMFEKKPVRQFGAAVGNANNEAAEIALNKKIIEDMKNAPKQDSQQPKE